MKYASLIFILAVCSIRAEAALTEKVPSQKILRQCYDDFGILQPKRRSISIMDLVHTNNLDLVKCGVEKGMVDTDGYDTEYKWEISQASTITYPPKKIYPADTALENGNAEMFEYLVPKTKSLFLRRSKQSTSCFSPFLRAAWKVEDQRLVRFVKDELIMRAKEKYPNFLRIEFFDEKDEETRARICARTKDKARCMVLHDFRIRTRAP
jgi:hypothetical protein